MSFLNVNPKSPFFSFWSYWWIRLHPIIVCTAGQMLTFMSVLSVKLVCIFISGSGFQKVSSRSLVNRSQWKFWFFRDRFWGLAFFRSSKGIGGQLVGIKSSEYQNPIPSILQYIAVVKSLPPKSLDFFLLLFTLWMTEWIGIKRVNELKRKSTKRMYKCACMNQEWNGKMVKKKLKRENFFIVLWNVDDGNATYGSRIYLVERMKRYYLSGVIIYIVKNF